MSAFPDILQRPARGTRRRVLSLIGILVVPFVIAGVLVWALWNPASRLENVRAAVVNNDEPVTVGEQLVPLGRQLTAELMRTPGSDAQNYDWVITDDEGAARGLASGEYVAAITIPKNFSAAATSSAGDDPRQATINVTTSDRSLLVDDAISTMIADTAARLAGAQVTENYLDNVFLGFNSLGDSLSEAAEGAGALGEGAGALAEGLGTLADGVGQLDAGAGQLARGMDPLRAGATELASGAGQLSAGVDQLAAGTGPLAGGARDLAAGAAQLAPGAQGLAGGLAQADAGAAGLAAGLQTVKQDIADPLGQLTGGLKNLASVCKASGGDVKYCDQLEELANNAALASGALSGTLDGTLPGAAPGLLAGSAGLAAGISEARAGAEALAAGAGGVASGATALADGATALDGGAAQLAPGARSLAAGAGTLSGGLSQLADGVGGLATGVGALNAGMPALTDGGTQLATGIDALHGGLTDAVQQLPRYDEDERTQLSSVVSAPIGTDGDGDAVSAIGGGFASAGGPFYAVLALWLGALASFLVLRAVPHGSHGSTRSSLSLALRSFWPSAIVGAVQGVLVAATLQLLLKLPAGSWLAFAAVSVLVGIAFAAVNQALGAVFGGAGKFLSMVVSLVVLATGIIATAPALLFGAASWLPVGPAGDALRGAIQGQGAAAGIAALLVWTVAALIATTLAIARSRRAADAETHSAAAPLPA